MNEMEGSGQTETVAVSRPFDVNRWSDYPELNNCLTSLVTELEAQESRERKRGTSERKKLREAVRALVLDLYVAWKTDPKLLVGVPLSNRSYTTKSRYRALFLHWSSFRSAYYLLLEVGYIDEVQAGFHDPRSGVGRNTRIRATQKLIDLLTGTARLTLPRVRSRDSGTEIIELRDSNKRPLEYDDTVQTSTMRATLELINTHLQRHWIDLRITDDEYRRLGTRMSRDFAEGTREAPIIDQTKRKLRRIFNNGDWEQGGRFYDGWWQNIPKEYRRHITIDDKPTAELDYSTFHAVMLYAQVGTALEGKAYDLGIPGIPRELVKVTFNKMINAPGRIRKPTDFPAQQINMTWEQFQAAIANRHAPIRHFFNSGAGVRLQKLDSELAQNIMLRFIGKGAGHVCLPVHDSFLVQASLADELNDVMLEEFNKLVGQATAVKTVHFTEWNWSEPSDEPTGYISPVIADHHFEGTGDYKGYEQRRLDWLYSMESVGSA